MKRHAVVVLTGLIALCSFGCVGKKQDYLPTPPTILNLPECPSPNTPVLPFIDGNRPLDSLYNIEAFLERDDTMRFYIKGLEATIECYQRRTINGSK